MSFPEDIASLSREELLALVAELQRQVTLLQQQVSGLAASNQELRGEVDRLTRQGSAKPHPSPRGPAPSSPGVPAASLERAGSLSARLHIPKKSPNLQ